MNTDASKSIVVFCSLLVGIAFTGCAEKDTDYVDILEELELNELAATFDDDKTQRFAPEGLSDASLEAKTAAAVLASLGLHGNRQEILSQWDSLPINQFLETTAQPTWLADDADTIAAFAERLERPLEERITTGYNIMPEHRWPSFDPAKTIIYGHNNLKHAKQLYALLLSEGLRPQISYLHKSSAFLFNDDWGEPSRPLKQLKNGERLVVAEEFDLCIEFGDTADIGRFHELMLRYAKKDTEDEAGLIHGSWWQPFYRTFQPSSFGKQLTVLLVRYEGYRTNLMSMPGEAEEKRAKLQAMHADWSVEPIDIWVNPAFYRFQLGDYR